MASVPKKGVAGLRLWWVSKLSTLGLSSYNAFVQFRNTDDSTSSSDDAVASNSNLVATIAATEAAIQIASDIIDSTLAHADDQSEQRIDRIQSNSIGKWWEFQI